ncbi:hypothetical protein [Psychroserpens sp. NJDZ02]|uniref:hypothetical protein n=1 Tax=Psychroserpens sp. NJDZ02 TaxID=2570561 RepID=UPI0010A92D25|nr:hypothetical protein [Psychroserpens sp. NJDZ02]QCE40151.1 hypothetical protein E9099_01505 [Psychroserpens sp. NJDZ02]
MKNIKETDEYVVVEFMNDSGNKYEVGYPKDSGYTLDNIEEELTNAVKTYQNRDLASFKDINWVPDGGSNTSRAAIKNGIVGGYVNKDNGFIYTYRLHFANQSGWGFTFKDVSDDTYHCSTPRNGNHYVDYNSGHPTMVGVD